MQTLSTNLDSLELSEINKDTLLFLVSSNEEVEEFLSEFWTGESVDQYEAILSYRLHKQKVMGMTYEQFVAKAVTYSRGAIEMLFQHPMSASDCKMFMKMKDKRDLSWSDLYDKHKKNPAYLALSLVL